VDATREQLEDDDGLLMASEVAQLELDADWIVLSACNTAAGKKGDAEALAGLAGAFLYAKARALLVSHWYVNSEATAKLTTGAFTELRVNPTIGRAEAVPSRASSPPAGQMSSSPSTGGTLPAAGRGCSRIEKSHRRDRLDLALGWHLRRVDELARWWCRRSRENARDFHRSKGPRFGEFTIHSISRRLMPMSLSMRSFKA
jgi:CHAT domain